MLSTGTGPEAACRPRRNAATRLCKRNHTQDMPCCFLIVTFTIRRGQRALNPSSSAFANRQRDLSFPKEKPLTTPQSCLRADQTLEEDPSISLRAERRGVSPRNPPIAQPRRFAEAVSAAQVRHLLMDIVGTRCSVDLGKLFPGCKLGPKSCCPNRRNREINLGDYPS